MEVADLSPGAGVTEAPETTMPGEPEGSLGEVQPWWQQLGLGCEKREVASAERASWRRCFCFALC